MARIAQTEDACPIRGQSVWPPWEAEPYRLWSLLDMLKPWAWHFGEFLSCILDRENSVANLDPAATLTPEDQSYMLHLLSSGVEHCKELWLDSGDQLERLRTDLYLSLESSPGFPVPRAGDLKVRLETLRASLDRELRSRRFLYVPPAKAEMYEQVELFGTPVHDRFGKASADIMESGTCIALDRPTAAVFHLMCVLEVGLDSLAYEVGIPYQQSSWHGILKDIEDATNALSPQNRPDWRETKEFCSRACLEFRFFKDAWRNHVAHARERYTEAQAVNIYDHVEAFIQHLAARLHERP